jgi:hypothetical protein
VQRERVAVRVAEQPDAQPKADVPRVLCKALRP